MTTAAEIGAVLAEARAEFLSLALDECEITKAGEQVGPRVLDENLQYTDPARVVVYRGPCRMQVKADINSNVVESTAGDREWTYLTGQLQLPVETPADAVGSVADVRPDQIAEITVALFDPSLEGRVFNVQGIYHKSQAGYQRFRVKEVVA